MPAAVALLGALLLVASGAVVSQVNRRAADGRLRRNGVAGIRVRATLRSDAAWQAGQRPAAQGSSDAAGAVFALTGVVALVARAAPWFAGVVLVGTVLATGVLLVVRRAVVAAAGADGGAGRRLG